MGRYYRIYISEPRIVKKNGKKYRGEYEMKFIEELYKKLEGLIGLTIYPDGHWELWYK